MESRLHPCFKKLGYMDEIMNNENCTAEKDRLRRKIMELCASFIMAENLKKAAVKEEANQKFDRVFLLVTNVIKTIDRRLVWTATKIVIVKTHHHHASG